MAPTASGALFALGDPGATQHGIYYNDLTTGVWTQMPGAAVSLSANSTSIYAVGAAGGIYVSAIAAPSPGPIVITAGGTYSGSWQSLDPKTPAVSITTTAAVTIQNCTIQSRGELIRATVPNAHVSVQNCSGTALDPLVSGALRGNFFSAYEMGSLTLEYNSIQGVNYGVQLYDPNGWVPSGPIVIRYNSAVILQGAPSDGHGGFILSNLAEPGDNQNHFIHMGNLQNVTGTEIAWNYIENDLGQSTIGDVIDLYSTSGTASSPILLHDNFIQGGYPAVPTSTGYYAGGITMDGSAADTAATATAFFNIYNNQIVAHANFGIGLAAGHDEQAYGNRVITSGQFSGGTWYDGYAGIYVLDCSCYTNRRTSTSTIARMIIRSVFSSSTPIQTRRRSSHHRSCAATTSWRIAQAELPVRRAVASITRAYRLCPH